MRVALLGGLMLLLTACSRPVAVEHIPVPQGANPVQARDLDPFTVEMMNALEDPVRNAVTDGSVTTLSYRLPAKTSIEALLAFYTNTLKDTDWERSEKLTQLDSQEQRYYARLGYERGEGEDEQVLLVDLLRNPTAKEPVLLLILATRR
ncbi:hypothetical protein [Leptolyngbya sp. FACHB-261]|uniref:hypothetical protein n=1 Tax=Leptolyngbya sp. FACHB-261 TaxID=2692806 RepID=UPI001688BEBC|nr:hypothetical protein [Leptolyngbya sp. FACHB-261]MBD2104454.1 hypothetical protein [Leptolyngbya sp. FACHB-261]